MLVSSEVLYSRGAFSRLMSEQVRRSQRAKFRDYSIIVFVWSYLIGMLIALPLGSMGLWSASQMIGTVTFVLTVALAPMILWSHFPTPPWKR